MNLFPMTPFNFFFTIPMLVAIPFALSLAGIAFLKD